ncbi:hypothetical protein [Hymenobacter negativus]|uniref:Uncharacterized protein n=1 Tax=Hymenobacter negativus TaxID=2795026 RepID=A0ABS3QED6_9BACT|nr:hypothetical protein [Hymenobacter negativus]MBO2009597.1 hypothetical protein [Hymenobacter negativus]
MRHLYGANQFSAFVSSRAWLHAGVDGRAEQEIQILQRQLDAFDEPDADEALATDHDWQLILAQAGVIMSLLYCPSHSLN